MRRLLSRGAALLIIVVATTAGATRSAAQNHHRDIGNSLVGTWRLAWLEEEGAHGNVQRADCSGLLVFTRDGHMSVQVMYRNQQATQAGPVQYAQGGYEASFGTYEVSGNAHTFTYHVEGALVRTLVGKNLTRVYQLSGSELLVKSPNENEHWRVAWQRY